MPQIAIVVTVLVGEQLAARFFLLPAEPFVRQQRILGIAILKDVLPPDSDVDDTTNVIFCAVSSAWIQYFYMCTWLWTLCYAINVRRQLSGARYALRTYHYYVWSISALLTGIGLTVLYVPDAE